MNNYSLTLAAAIVGLCVGLNEASAGLLGMPLNLKIAVERADLDAPVPACQFYTDDVVAGPVLVKRC